jgi:hypothetical protein
MDQISHHLSARLLAGLVNFLQFCLGFSIGVLFCLLVSAGMLWE